MAKTIKLASVLLKCGLGTGTTEHHKKITGGSLVSPVLLLCLAPVMYYLFRGGIILQQIFGDIDGDGLILGFLLFLISSFIFCTGIATCINSFYLSSNLNTLLVMPFSSGQITGAKFIVAAVYEYAISLTVLAPLLVGYGYAMQASAPYWVGAALSVLFLPIAPLAYAAIISMIVMRFIGSAKKKDRMAEIGAIAVFVIMAILEIIEASTKGMKITAVKDVIAHLAQTLKELTVIFPDIPFLVRIMEKGDWLSILWSSLLIVVILIVFLFAAKHLYLAGAIGMQDTSAAHKKLTAKQLKRESRNTNIVWSYTRKELRIILRTPAYYTSCLFITLGWPVVLLLPLCFSKAQQARMAGFSQLMLHESSPVYFMFLLFCVVYGITTFTTTTNAIAPLSISREGKSFYIMKQLPVPYRKQLRAKQNAALLICCIGSGGYMAVGEIILIFIAGFPWWAIFPTIIFNILLLYIIVDLEMIYGLLNPKLVWESEGDVASKCRVCFVLFLLGIVIGCIVIYGLNDWVKSLTCGPLAFTAGLCGILAALAFCINRIFYLLGERRLTKL